MSNEKCDRAGDFLDRLFGNVDELAGEDLDILFETVAPGEDPAERVRALAKKSAYEYRKQDKIPPEHVLRALAATQQRISLDGADESTLRKIMDQVLKPVRVPVHDSAFPYRNLRESEVTEQDRDVLNELEEMLKEDWSDDEEK